MDALRDCALAGCVGVCCMESAANSDASGVLAVPETPRLSIEVRQHRVTCDIGILGGIVRVFAGRIPVGIAITARELLENWKLATASGGSLSNHKPLSSTQRWGQPPVKTHLLAHRNTLSKQYKGLVEAFFISLECTLICATRRT